MQFPALFSRPLHLSRNPSLLIDAFSTDFAADCRSGKAANRHKKTILNQTNFNKKTNIWQKNPSLEDTDKI
jgi:hypothetical protein